MKTNFLIKTNIITLLVVFSLFTFVGCQQDDELNMMNEEFPFLTLSANTDYSNLSLNELEILRAAFKRVDISTHDDYFYLKQTSGAKVNISEELFLFIKKAVDNTNEMIKTAEIDLSIPRTRSASEGGETSKTDCVAQVVASLLARLGKSTDVSIISRQIENQYGTGGVPMYAFNTVLGDYFYGSPVPVPVNSQEIIYGNVAAVIRVPGQPFAHAVTVLQVVGGTIVYQDPQNGGKAGMCSTLNLMSMYRVDGVR